jgi:predicted amidohydrolase YtcJ
MIDSILYNAKGISMDPQGNTFQALAIEGDKIAALGRDEEILRLAGPGTKLINAQGKTLIPGLIDSHSHFASAAATELRGTLLIPQSVEELLMYIRKEARNKQKGEWLYFRNTYPSRMKEGRFPTIQELDEAAPDHPVFVDAAYAGQANSFALKQCGISGDTDIAGVGRDQTNGRLNGLFVGCGDLIKRHIPFPEYSAEDMADAAERLQKEYHKVGITSVIDGATSIKAVEAYNNLFESGRLGIRVVYTQLPESREKLQEKISDFQSGIYTPPEWGKNGFLKLILDGGILTGTAYMRKPYAYRMKLFNHKEDYRGSFGYSREDLVFWTQMAYDNRLQMTAHCIGDAAVDELLAAYEEVDHKNAIGKRRFTMIHADFTDQQVLYKMKDLGILILSQPAWHYMDGDLMLEVGDKEAMESFLPYRDMEDIGICVAAGSDHMAKHDPNTACNPYNPFIGMYSIITRKTRTGKEVYPEQKVSRYSALKAYTVNGAYASFDEDKKGTLEAGKLADMVLLSKDFFTCPEDEIPGITSELTIVGGRTQGEHKGTVLLCS